MKLKYYLRGAAVGILLATLILTIANSGNKPLTDAQIRQRALEIGMVDGDSLKLSSLQSETPVGDTGSGMESVAVSATSESETVKSSAETASGVTLESETVKSSAETASGVTLESSSVESSTVSSEGTGAEKGSTPSQGGNPVILEIRSGASSYTVSRDLAAAGLVEDAKAYDDYLCNNGYARKIHIGTYEILPGASEEEIAKIIAY